MSLVLQELYSRFDRSGAKVLTVFRHQRSLNFCKPFFSLTHTWPPNMKTLVLTTAAQWNALACGPAEGKSGRDQASPSVWNTTTSPKAYFPSLRPPCTIKISSPHDSLASTATAMWPMRAVGAADAGPGEPAICGIHIMLCNRMPISRQMIRHSLVRGDGLYSQCQACCALTYKARAFRNMSQVCRTCPWARTYCSNEMAHELACVTPMSDDTCVVCATSMP